MEEEKIKNLGLEIAEELKKTNPYIKGEKMTNIKIGGYIIDIAFDDKLLANTGNIGEYSPIEQRITLATGLTLQQQKETLIHEIIEAINNIYELGFEHDEQLCKLSVILHQIITITKSYSMVCFFVSNKGFTSFSHFWCWPTRFCHRNLPFRNTRQTCP